MMKKYNMRLLSLACFVLFTGLLWSCKKENDATTTKIELLSFGPTGARHGDTLRFIGTNLNKVTEIVFTGATVAQTGFLEQTFERILVVVPAKAEKGLVTLKTPDGDIVSKTILNLKVAAKVASMTPQARPGENITLKGDFMNWVRRVTFVNDKVVSTFVSQSLNELVLKIPEDAQTGPLLIFYHGTDSMQVQTADTLRVTLPMATSLSPNPVKHQTNLTITGTNLDLAKQVVFTGVTAPVTTFVSQSATQIVVRVPASARKGKISLVAASGVVTQTTQDMDVVLPVATTMAPNPVDHGANLTITGTNLDLVTSVSFTGALAAVNSFVSQSATQLVVKVPAGSLKGKLTFGVLNSTLTTQSADDLVLNGGLPALADFAFPIYTDGLHNDFQNWSWAGNDFNSAANVRQGTKSIKVTYGGGGYEGITFNRGTAMSTAAYTTLEFSVFGEAGTGGKKLNVVVNEQWGSPVQVTLVQGEWATFSISLSSISALGSPAQLKQLIFQSAGFTGVVHVDHVGLR